MRRGRSRRHTVVTRGVRGEVRKHTQAASLSQWDDHPSVHGAALMTGARSSDPEGSMRPEFTLDPRDDCEVRRSRRPTEARINTRPAGEADSHGF